MSKVKFNEQAEKLKTLVGSARLQTSSATTSHNGETTNTNDEQVVVAIRTEPAKTKAKNLKAIPLSYFEAHAELKASSKTSLDFSSYIIEAIREKLEHDGAIGK